VPRVSAHISTGGKPDAPTPTPCQGKVVEFGEAYYEFPSEASVGWVNACAWSPSGHTLAFAGHDSSLVVVTFPPGDGAPVEQVLRFADLPLTTLCFVSEVTLLACRTRSSSLSISLSLVRVVRR